MQVSMIKIVDTTHRRLASATATLCYRVSTQDHWQLRRCHYLVRCCHGCHTPCMHCFSHQQILKSDRLCDYASMHACAHVQSPGPVVQAAGCQHVKKAHQRHQHCQVSLKRKQ